MNANFKSLDTRVKEVIGNCGKEVATRRRRFGKNRVHIGA